METVYRNNYPNEVVESRPNSAIVTLIRAVWFVAYLIEGFLALRFVLEALGASRGAGFTNFVYNLTNPLVSPFRGIFHSSTSGLAVLDWTAVVAMIVYWLVAWAITRLLSFAIRDTVTTGRNATTVVEDNSPSYFEDDATVVKETPSYVDYRIRKQRKI